MGDLSISHLAIGEHPSYVAAIDRPELDISLLQARGFARSSRSTVKGDWTGQVFERETASPRPRA